jgi:hypothetical protein
MATIAVFFVLSGGTAVALNGSNTVFSDDIVDNQVFSADVRNDRLAGGGLAASDLRAGSVGHSEVIDNSLTGADIKESTLRGVAGVRIDSEVPATATGPLVKVLQSKGLTLSGRCVESSGVVLQLLATGPAGSVVNFSGIRDQFNSIELRPYLDGATLSATPSGIAEVFSDSSGFGLNYLHGVYRSALNTVSFEINAVATEGGGGICQFHGTATPTP